MKPALEFTIIKEDQGYSAYCNYMDDFIATQADDFYTLKNNIIEAINLHFENQQYDYDFKDLKVNYDLPSFFNFYRVINAKALSERIGMNQSLLAQYIGGQKNPSPKQTKRILDGVHQIGKELLEVRIT